jgi:RNA:NAD 2''-phosphotransferase
MCPFCDKLSRTLSAYLRHHGGALRLDSEGYASGDRLLAIMRSGKTSWELSECTMVDLERIVDRSLHERNGEPRFEIRREASGILSFRATDEWKTRRRGRRSGSAAPPVRDVFPVTSGLREREEDRAVARSKDERTTPTLPEGDCSPQDMQYRGMLNAIHKQGWDRQWPESENKDAARTSAVGAATAPTQSFSVCSADAVVMDREETLKREFAEVKEKLEALTERVANQAEEITQLRSELDRWNRWWYRWNS